MRRLTTALSNFRETTGPAGTLLVITVLLVVATSFARARAATPPPTWTSIVAHTPEQVTPGQRFDVTVQVDSSRSLAAYLPGLDLARVPLTYDADLEAHVAQITLPWFAPPRGECTLRIIDDAGLELDVQLGLRAASQS